MDFKKLALAHPISSGVATFLLLSVVSFLGKTWIKNEKEKGNDTFFGYLLNGSKS